MYNVLVVEDSKDIYVPLCDFLEEEHYSTELATTQAQAIALLEDPKKQYDLALIDLLLPDGHGFSVFPFADKQNIPVIFLTAMDDEHNTSIGLELGAADYIPKPYRRKELLSRMKNALRKSGKMQSKVSCRDIVVDETKAAVYKNGQEVYLTKLEYKLLLVFMHRIGSLVTRAELIEKIYDITGEDIYDNTLNVHIKRLREKIEDDPKNPTFIQTIRGMGYKIEKEQEG